MYWLSEEFLWRAIYEHVRHGLKGNFPNHEWMNWNDRGIILATWYLSDRLQSAIIWKRVSVLQARNKRWQIPKQSDGRSSIWCTGTGKDAASDICPSSGIVSWRQDRIYLYSHTCGKTETVSTQTTPHLSLSHGLKCTKYTISTISSRVELHRVVRCSKLQNQTT